MKVAIVKYNAGNIHSVYCALARLGAEVVITDDPKTLRAADKVVFPGVGQAASSMAYLQEHGLDTVIRSLTQPVLGICIGMQLLCSHSEEGNVDCLGIFDQPVLRFDTAKKSDCKVPQMGWNQIADFRTPLFDGVAPESHVYYVHSYYVPLCADTIATTDYIQPYSAALHHGNFYATQFHPEKSGSVGELILKNFLNRI
jgi:glutamine amidotransferase